MGDSLQAVHDGLHAGGTALTPVEPVSSSRALAPEAPDPYLNGRHAYSLDRPARLLVAAAQLALADGRWLPEDLRGRACRPAARGECFQCALFCDVDRDGDRDLFVVRYLAPCRLYLNRGDGTFEDATPGSGLDFVTPATAATFFDYDGDGHVDLCVANDFGRKVLYRNNGDGTFTDVAKAAGVLDFSGGMGLAFADMNFDGRPDLYTSNINSNQRWFGEEITLWQYGIKMIYDCHLLMVRSHTSPNIGKDFSSVPSLSERTLGTATRTSFCSSAWGMGHSPTWRGRWGATRSRTGAEWRSPT